MAMPVEAFFEHNAWANERLIELCAGLSDEQLDATAIGTFGSIRETLLHTVGTEQRYLRRLGAAVAADAVEGVAFPGFEVLGRAARASGAALARVARATGAAEVVRDVEGFAEARTSVLLVQVLNHSAEHRTQVAAIFAALGVGPRDLDEQIDGWSWGVATGQLRPSGG